METLKLIVRQPLELTETTAKFDVLVNVYGGGFTGTSEVQLDMVFQVACWKQMQIIDQL